MRYAGAQQAATLTCLRTFPRQPCGIVSAQAEHGHTPALSLLTRANRAPHCRLPLPGMAKRMGDTVPTKGLAALGRLDLDSSGLLIFSNDGVLAKKLIGSIDVEKEYEVVVAPQTHVSESEWAASQKAPWKQHAQRRVLAREQGQQYQTARDINPGEHWRTMDLDREHLGDITEGLGVADMDHALAILNAGMLQLDRKLLRPALVERVGVNPPLQGIDLDADAPPTETWRFVLTEGRKRQIRRMCALVGVDVVALRRLRVGTLWLGDLQQSQWQVVQPRDILGGEL